MNDRKVALWLCLVGGLAVMGASVADNAQVSVPGGTPSQEPSQFLDSQVAGMRLEEQFTAMLPVAELALRTQSFLLGEDHPDTLQSMWQLGMLYQALGRIADGQRLYQKGLEISERAHGKDHHDTLRFQDMLAWSYFLQGKPDEAENHFRELLERRERSLGLQHSDTLKSVKDLAGLYQSEHRHEEAIPLLRRLIQGYESDNSLSPVVMVQGLSKLARAHQALGHYGEAEALLLRALALSESAYQADSVITLEVANNLGALHHARGRLDEAETLFRRVTAGVATTSEYELIIVSHANLGRLLVDRQDDRAALPNYVRAVDTLEQLFAAFRGADENARYTTIEKHTYIYSELMALLLRLHQQEPDTGHDRNLLAVASRRQSRVLTELLRERTVQALEQTAPEFIALRDRHRALLKQSSLRFRRLDLMAEEFPDAQASSALARDVAAARQQLTALEQELWTRFPTYMELTEPRPVTVDRLQKDLLRADESLLMFVTLPEETLVLAVSQDHFRLHRASAWPENTLQTRLQALRNDLGAVAAPDTDFSEQINILNRLDPALLHTLYQDLVAPVADLLPATEAGRVLVTADGPLYSLPLEMLVSRFGEREQRTFRRATKDSENGTRPPLSQYATLAYLGGNHRFSYLPSLATLAAQRLYPKPRAESERKPLVAFADPVFAPDQWPTTASLAVADTTAEELRLVTRGGDVLDPLPGTALSARELAALLDAPQPLLLQLAAQEATLKTLSGEGALKGLRYLLLATHGLLGGEFVEFDETPPPDAGFLSLSGERPPPVVQRAVEKPQPSLALTLVGDLQGESGLLTLAEVLGLDLDVDLAILSACNTAGGDDFSARGEGFVGMARAFLFAGARHLWVSHWYVEDRATADLITAAVAAHEANPSNPEQALAVARQSIRESVVEMGEGFDRVTLSRAHPFFWAAFVSVGD